MRLPDFLVIGGMKCGSTTLYRDLLGHPDIFFPDKELSFLTSKTGVAPWYASHFASAPQSTVCGEVSTTYSMLPDHPGVAQRAAQILSRDTKIIYLVREPISRAISHHRHMNAWHGPGQMGHDIDLAICEHPSIVNYNRYAMQLRPWRDAFGDKAISVVVLEEYMVNRKGTIERLLEFLGVPPDSRHIRVGKVYNRSDDKTVLSPIWLSIWKTPLYQRIVRPLLSMDFRESVRGAVLPIAPRQPDPPSIETVDRLIEIARDDEKELRSLLDRNTPIWDFGLVRARFQCDTKSEAA